MLFMAATVMRRTGIVNGAPVANSLVRRRCLNSGDSKQEEAGLHRADECCQFCEITCDVLYLE